MSTLQVLSTTSALDTNDDALVCKVIAAREDERARIARDLHDRLGQHLTALRLMLEQHQVDFRSSTRATMDRALAIVREIDAELDHLAWELRPGPRPSRSRRITSAARPAVDGFRSPRRRLPLRRRLRTAVAGPASDDLPCCARGTAQCSEHAHATRIYVLSELRSDSLVLLVQDDGVGFEPMNRCRPSGSGLIGMNERAALAGGTLHVESSLGHGTTVFLRIPLERPAAWRRAVSRAIRSTASSTGLRERVGA